MDPTEALTTIAEIAVTLAGFTGIITVMQRSEMTGEQIVRILNMLMLCFMIIFGSLLPFVLKAFELNDQRVWSSSCISLGFLILAFDAWGTFAVYRAKFRPILPAAMIVILLILGSMGLSLVAIGAGLVSQPSLAVVLTALVTLVLFACYAFVTNLLWVYRDAREQ